MTTVNQTKLYTADGIHNGNCFAACLASLLDLPLWMVPPFEDMFGRGSEYRERCNQWLERCYKLRLVRVEGHPAEGLPEFYIANGRSRRNVYHSVIYWRGVITHDPHPAKDGLLDVEWCWYLEAL